MPNEKKPSTLKKSSANRPKQNRQQRKFPNRLLALAKKGVVSEAEEITSTSVVETAPLSSVGLRKTPRWGRRFNRLSKPELANSESVEELLEEGNAFEGEAVEGVEAAPDADEGEH